MRSLAAKRNAAALRNGRATLLIGDAQDPPSDLGTFDAIFCCNVWLFWDDADTTIQRLARLLAPAGRLAITHLPRHGNPTRHETDQAAHRIERQMQRAGLIHVECAYLPLSPAPAVCVTGQTN